MITLQHGDCLEIMPSIPDQSIDMILCDLPYGTTACKWDVVIPFEPLWKEYKRIIKDRGCIALFGSEPFSSYLRMSNIKQYKYDWIWEKEQGSNYATVKNRPFAITENISIFNSSFYFPMKTEGKKYKDSARKRNLKHSIGESIKKPIENNGDRYPVNIVFFQNDTKKGYSFHPTQKPVALLEYLIKTYTLECEKVLDNCMGSGSTGVACVNTGRNFIGIEKEKNYFDIAQKRIDDAVNDRAGILL